MLCVNDIFLYFVIMTIKAVLLGFINLNFTEYIKSNIIKTTRTVTAAL